MFGAATIRGRRLVSLASLVLTLKKSGKKANKQTNNNNKKTKQELLIFFVFHFMLGCVWF